MTRRRKQPRPVTTSRSSPPVSDAAPPSGPVVAPAGAAPARTGVHGVEGLVGFIATGSLDEHLALISRAIVERRRLLMRRDRRRVVP